MLIILLFSLKTIVVCFERLSSAKVNWTKSRALAVGDELIKQLVLPGGLVWRRGVLKYLGVHLCDETFSSKNWDCFFLEKVEGCLKAWKWILPDLSFKGCVLIINNLVSSMLWHRLAVLDPPINLLSKVQAIIVDFFWVPQSVFFLPKQEGGHGLVHLASRGAAFRLQFFRDSWRDLLTWSGDP